MKINLKSSVIKKIAWVIFYLFIYVLGGKLAVPFVDIEKSFYLGGATETFQLVSAISGGNLRNISFLSLGLSPWMSAMLISRMFSQIKKNPSQITKDKSDRRSMYLTMVIALIQSLAISLNLPLQAGVDPVFARIVATVVLMAGSFFLVWLADMNAVTGIGGTTPILMIGMLMYLPSDLYNTIVSLEIGPVWVALIGMVSLVFLYVAVIVEFAKYRLPINKLGINNEFRDYSYLDIKINLSGGMAIMYAMTFTIIPQYLLLLLRYFYPGKPWINEAMSSLQMGKLPWFLLYIFTLGTLSYAFSLINFNPEEIANKMKKNGEYIYGVYPGKDTYKFLSAIVGKFALIGTTYTVTMVGLPLAFSLIDVEYMRLSMAPGLLLIFVGLSFTISNEINAVQLNESYQKLF